MVGPDRVLARRRPEEDLLVFLVSEDRNVEKTHFFFLHWSFQHLSSDLLCGRRSFV